MATLRAAINTIGVNVIEISTGGDLEMVVMTANIYTTRVFVKGILIYSILKKVRVDKKLEPRIYVG